MVKSGTKALRFLSIFLLGKTPEIISRTKTEQDTQTDEVLERYDLSKESKLLVRNDKDLLGINIRGAHGFIIFPYVLQRFAPLIYLAETRKPIIIVSEENTFMHALEAYDYLSDHQNVQVVFSPGELEARIQAVEAAKWLGDYKVCLFDDGNWALDGIAWQKNPLFMEKLNVQNVTVVDLVNACEDVGKSQAESLARKWMKESEVLEPSLEDVKKVAQIYLAMKTMLKKTESNAAYVLWCGQFAKQLPKMCFALAKLADDGYPVGCWRGGNLLPMLMLHKVSNKPVFTPEAFTHKGKTVSLRHCFVPGEIGPCRYTLRNWRTTKGTVTGYCKLPKGGVTLVNCGIGDKMVVTTGRVVDCRDIGGKNCRITIWVEVGNEEAVHEFSAREFAMVYGDYEKEVKELAGKLGITIL